MKGKERKGKERREKAFRGCNNNNKLFHYIIYTTNDNKHS